CCIQLENQPYGILGGSADIRADDEVEKHDQRLGVIGAMGFHVFELGDDMRLDEGFQLRIPDLVLDVGKQDRDGEVIHEPGRANVISRALFLFNQEMPENDGDWQPVFPADLRQYDEKI